jgi:hypothetical protein
MAIAKPNATSAPSTGEGKRSSDVSVVKLSMLLSPSESTHELCCSFINAIVIGDGDEKDRLGLRGQRHVVVRSFVVRAS